MNNRKLILRFPSVTPSRVCVKVNPKRSADLQIFLFKAGYSWNDEKSEVDYIDRPYLYIDRPNKSIFYGSSVAKSDHEVPFESLITYFVSDNKLDKGSNTMKVTKKVSLTLTLSEEEAAWLKENMRNPLNGKSPFDERKSDSVHRVALFTALDEA